jgi:hypothetical protein
MLKKFVLHKTAVRDASAPASFLPIDGWQQLRLQLRLWWERFRRLSQRRPRRLRLCESLPMGEHRFVAVVEFERSRFLVGGTTSSLVLLARLGTGQGQEDTSDKQDPQDKDETHERNEKKYQYNDEIATPALPAAGISGRFEP